MNVWEKINRIFSHIEKQAVDNSPEANALITESHAKEREEFTNVLIDNLKNKKISYDEAVARAKMYAKNNTDLSLILARIGEHEVSLAKTAKINNSQMEVEDMDKVKRELARLRSKLPKYAAWLENLLKKQGWNLGTGDKIPVDEYDTGVMKEEDKRKEAEIKEGEKLMNEHAKERENALRASNSWSLKKAEDVKKKDNPRESTKVDPKEYDIGVMQEEDRRWKAEVKEGEKLMNEHAKERERVLRATKEMFDVRFVKDSKNVKNSSWQIIDKADGKVIVSATLDDITDGQEIDAGALAEAQSPAFGEVILEEIADNGLISTAKNMLGKKFEKLAKGKLDKPDIEDEENPYYADEDEDNEDYGLHVTTEEMEEETQKAEEEGLEGEHGIDEEVPSLKSKSDKELDDEESEKLEILASKYFQYKGIVSELKPSLLKFATDTNIKGLKSLIVNAEQKLDEVKNKLEEGAPSRDIGKSLSIAVEAVGDISDVSDLIEQAKQLSKDNPKLMDILNKIADIVVESEEDISESEFSEDLLPVEESDIETPTYAETNKEDEEMESKKINEKSIFEEDKEEEDKEEEDKEEEKDKEKEEKKETKANLANKLRKLAAKDNKGNYDVTPKANFEKEFHGDSKGKINVEGNHFHTIWEIAKELESLAGKKATGKLAKIIYDMKKFAESKGIDPKEYFNKILEDSKYVNEYLSEKTPDSVLKEWAAATKDTNDVYAFLVNRVKLAYKTALDMQNKGLLKKTAADLDAQINRFLAMDEKTFNAYVDSLEQISPTKELEDGRFKVAVLDKPTQNGSIIQGYVDNIPVCGISGEDIQIVNGVITKESLHKALNLVKVGLDQGFFDSILSNNAAPGNTGGESDLRGLNLGVSEVKNIKDLLG